MRIIERHIVSGFISSFIFCIMLLMVLGVIGDILGFLDDIFKNDIPLLSIISFYLYFAPFAFVNMVPFASLLAAVFVFNDLSKNHEITAIIASGISLWKLVKPILLVTTIICIFTFIVNERVVPTSMEKAARVRREKLETRDSKKEVTIKNLAIYGKGDQIVFMREYFPSKNMMESVIVHKQDSQNNVTLKVNAASAHWNGTHWLGKDVVIFNLDPSGKIKFEPEVHLSKKMPIQEKPRDFVNFQSDPKLMSYKQLDDYIGLLEKSSSSSVNRLKVDLNYKLAFPFASLVTVIIGIPFSIATGRVNTLVGMAKGIGVAVMYMPVMAVSLALGKGGSLSPILAAHLANIIFVLAGIYFIDKKS